MDDFEDVIPYNPSKTPDFVKTINLNDRTDKSWNYKNQYLIWTHEGTILYAGKFNSYGYYFRTFDFELP
jgi:hypothetical protein